MITLRELTDVINTGKETGELTDETVLLLRYVNGDNVIIRTVEDICIGTKRDDNTKIMVFSLF